ncbi:MAG: hypothetical protein CBC01_09075 [Betaproteobacteria bacterium TMED41]|nr:MAG: hypothetical protein CBC01_09075 [Betaproteobacteria bacterium TMED41]
MFNYKINVNFLIGHTMASFMDEEPEDKGKGNIHSIYTNICLTLIVICLVIIAVTSVLEVTVKNTGNSNVINKIAVCDPQNGRCVKVNAGRRLETTN